MARIAVAKGVTRVSQANITDLRLNSSECGVVRGSIEEIDTTTIFNEYQTWITEKKAQFDSEVIDYSDAKKIEWDSWFNVTSAGLESDFAAWFLTVQNTLDGDTAGNLLNLINAVPKVLSGTTEPAGMKRRYMA